MTDRLAADVPVTARHTLMALMLFADERDVARVSGPRLARVLGCSPRSMERRIGELRKLGLVGPAHRREIAPGTWSIGYPITLPPLPASVQGPVVVDEVQRAIDGVPF